MGADGSLLFALWAGGQHLEYTREGELRARQSSEESYDVGLQDRLWDASVELVAARRGEAERGVFPAAEG